MLALALLALIVAQPAPFHSVKDPEADARPWHGDETFELSLTDSGRSGARPDDGPWKQEVVATLKVRKVPGGHTLSLRLWRWWWGSGPQGCDATNLVHLRDQDATLDENGQVIKLTLLPLPPEARALAGCPDAEKSAAELWNTLALLVGAAKQRVFSYKRIPMPALGTDGFVDRTISYKPVAGRGRALTSTLGILYEHFQAGPGGKGPVDRRIDSIVQVDEDGRFRYFNRSRTEAATQRRSDLAIRFVPAKDGRRR